MNRFVKQNLLLITVMSIASVIIVALLVYSGIVYYQMSNCISETENLRKRIGDLIRNSPAPVDGNKPLIQQDIDLFTKLNAAVSERVGSPYKKAGEVFISVLEGVKGSDKIEEARKAFVEKFNDSVGKADNPASRGIALDVLRRKYQNTWDKALKAFVAAVSPLTQEPDLDVGGEDFAFFTIGIPRTMQNQPDNMRAYSGRYREKLMQLLGEKISPDATSFGFSFLENPTATYANTDGEGNAPKTPFPPADIPLIAQHWDIVGDICKRIASVDFKTVNFFAIRGINKENGSYAESFERRGNYLVSHYTFEVTASLDVIRALAYAFGYNSKDKRLYAVRSIFLYATKTEFRTAMQMLDPRYAVVQDQEKKETQPVVGRRRRGAVVAEPQEAAPVNQENEMRAKWLEDFEKREKSLPFYQRQTYGEVKLGALQEYRAVFDIDYIQLAGQN